MPVHPTTISLEFSQQQQIEQLECMPKVGDPMTVAEPIHPDTRTKYRYCMPVPVPVRFRLALAVRLHSGCQRQ